MSPRQIASAFLGAVLGGYIAAAAVGAILPLAKEIPLDEALARAGLRLAFARETQAGANWEDVSGTTLHHPLIRRAYLRGTSDGAFFSEQVLKVGWPFTLVRGFVRVRAGEIRPRGAMWLRGDATSGPVMFFPFQPVWPGLLFTGLVLTPLLLAVSLLARRSTGPGEGEGSR